MPGKACISAAHRRLCARVVPECRPGCPANNDDGPAARALARAVHGSGRNTTRRTLTPMQAASYIALSSQMALHRQLDVVANNLANSSTPAFKAERMLFSEFLDRR